MDTSWSALSFDKSPEAMMRPLQALRVHRIEQWSDDRKERLGVFDFPWVCETVHTSSGFPGMEEREDRDHHERGHMETGHP
jgi:hypothetical protein